MPGFTKRSEDRIADVVVRVERERVNPPAPRRRPRSRDSTLRRFELIEHLPSGATRNATARLLQWTGGVYVAQSDVEFEVYDPDTKFIQVDKPTGQDGARGLAQFMWDRGVWEIVSMQWQARWIEFVVDNASGFDTTDASVAVSDATYHDGYTPNDDVVIVYNKKTNGAFMFVGVDDVEGMALYDPVTDKYTIVQIDCPGDEATGSTQYNWFHA